MAVIFAGDAMKGINDDLLFQDQQKRKRAPKARPPVAYRSACCGTCKRWIQPEMLASGKPEQYGTCQAIMVTNKGRFLTEKESVDLFESGDALRTSGGYRACSQYRGEYDVTPDSLARSPFDNAGDVTTMSDLLRLERTE